MIHRIDSFGFLWVSLGSFGFLLVPLGSFESFWVLLGPFGSFWVISMGSLQFLRAYQDTLGDLRVF